MKIKKKIGYPKRNAAVGIVFTMLLCMTGNVAHGAAEPVLENRCQVSTFNISTVRRQAFLRFEDSANCRSKRLRAMPTAA